MTMHIDISINDEQIHHISVINTLKTSRGGAYIYRLEDAEGNFWGTVEHFPAHGALWLACSATSVAAENGMGFEVPEKRESC